MDLKKLLQTTPESLALEQYNALNAAVVSHLGKMQGHIQRGDFKMAAAMTFHSPSGDCMGCDNTCISFAEFMESDEPPCDVDIGDVIARLSDLKTIIDKTPVRKAM